MRASARAEKRNRAIFGTRIVKTQHGAMPAKAGGPPCPGIGSGPATPAIRWSPRAARSAALPRPDAGNRAPRRRGPAGARTLRHSARPCRSEWSAAPVLRDRSGHLASNHLNGFNPTAANFASEWVDLAAGPGGPGGPGTAGMRRSRHGWPVPPRRNGNKCWWRSRFPLSPDTTLKLAIWSFASPEGFVIRCRLANDCFACSSVAQR